MDLREAYWESQPPTAGPDDRHGTHDRYSIGIDPENPADLPALYELAVAAVLRYEIYPPGQMRALVCSPDKKAHAGTLVIQRILFGPFAIEAAVRITDLIEDGDSGRTAGFSYVTLRGHAEKGLASFSIRRMSGEMKFEIESWSAPAKGLAILMAPLSRRLQKAFTLRALAHFRNGISKAIKLR